ncbi:MAG: hypothetical protein KAY59_07900 [Acidobacteria bacterium]|jgi:hypothetical protein|nr:hypothetical protein [Acidobacteriota bacterium]
MVLTKDELIGSLQHEVKILVHLAGKVDDRSVDYRPAPKMRSTIEWLRYMTLMGPALLNAAQTGTFDGAAWGAKQAVADQMDLAQVTAAIASQGDLFAKEIGAMSDADFRGEIEMFGQKYTRGSFIVNLVLCGYAAYRTQIFVHLKSCGREELNTMNLWAGMDAPQ